MKRIIVPILFIGILAGTLSLFSLTISAESVVTFPSKPVESMNYSSYKEFATVAKEKNFRAFVPYPYIEVLGTLTEAKLYKQYSDWYEYDITDKNGFSFQLTVEEERPYGPVAKTFYPTETTQDMRSSDLYDGMHSVCMDGIYYTYSHDCRLRWIFFFLSEDPESPYYECVFSFKSSTALADYPTDGEETFFSRLLRKETALDAVHEIRDMATGKAVMRKQIVIGSGAGIVVIATAIALPIVIVKRKKKKAARASEEPLM